MSRERVLKFLSIKKCAQDRRETLSGKYGSSWTATPRGGSETFRAVE